jgi:hypothetical protein
MTSADDHLRILSLDGGGTWALLQARTLAAMFPGQSGLEVLSHFDMVVANSGGSLVAAGLMADLAPETLVGWFRDEPIRRALFHSLPGRAVRSALLHPQYSTEAKLAAIEKLFSTRSGFHPRERLADWAQNRRARGLRCPDVLILAFDAARRRSVYLRSNVGSRAASAVALAGAVECTVLEAVHASANPPVLFFDQPAWVAGRHCWDGALGGYNNPVMAGVVELLANAEDPLDARRRIKALSMGTGLIEEPIESVSRSPNWVRDVKLLGTAILDDPPDNATFVSHVMLGHRLPRSLDDVVSDGPIVRMNPHVHHDDDSRAWRSTPTSVTERDPIERLRALQLDASAPEDIALIDRLCDEWMRGTVSNQALRWSNHGAQRALEVGHATFAAAWAEVSTWLDIAKVPPALTAGTA